MQIKTMFLAGSMLLASAVSFTAVAADEATVLDDRSYVGVMAGVTIPDDQRPQNYDEDALTYKILYGWAFSEHMNHEFSFAHETAQYDFNGVDDNHDIFYKVGYDLLYFLNRDGWAPYGLIGGGITFAKRQPNDHEYGTINAGLGVSKAFNDHGAALRAEARYLFNWDNHGGNDKPGDIRVLVGMTLPISAKPAPPPPVVEAPPAANQDSDGDGVIDSRDKCPGTLANVKVDGTGCAVVQTLKLNGVKFAFDSAKLLPNAKIILDEVAESIKGQPDMKVEIAGHTDRIGDDAYNMQLSDRRAKSVRDYLVSKGANDANFTSKGYGETEPVATNDTAAGRAQNRRVEFRILGQ